LRTRHRYRRACESTLMQTSQSVEGMPFGHADYSPSAPGTGGTMCVRS
jgi:hypothetical protein